MAEADRGRPHVFTIPVHRSFSDALANGLLRRYGRDPLELARGTILLPNNRSLRAVQDAFVRRADHGLLLPRLVPIGDVEQPLGAVLDPASDRPEPPAIGALTRRFLLARVLQEERALTGAPVEAAEALRLAGELARSLDALIQEEVDPSRLLSLDIGADLSLHWQRSLDLFAIVIDRWPEVLAATGLVELAERRNRALRRLATEWTRMPPSGFVVAAGVTSAVPAIARLLRAIARLPQGMVVLPGLDLASPAAEWDAIVEERIESHPQHHLRLLLDRMGVARSDVVRWRWGDGRERKAVRARVVSNAFAPARFTSKWTALPLQQVSLRDVRGAEFLTPADEAQGIAIALREALETPGRTAALVTPDRVLAARVANHLKRWGIDADDSAGRPLSATPAGTLILAVAAVAVDRFAPVALLALLKHPLVMAGEGRQDWLTGARVLDRALRGPRPAPGLEGLRAHFAGGARAVEWWATVEPLFAPLEAAFAERAALPDLLEAVRATVQVLTGDGAWAGPAGRAAGALFDMLADAVLHGPRDFATASLVPLLRDVMRDVAVRPPQGGHPRISIWGLLEARLQSADLLVLGGLNEGVWPADPAPDAWLAPKVRQELGLGGLERRVGLAAHDLAMALGGRQVLMTRSERDARSPTIASRFWLRLDAMTGGIARDTRLVALARAIDAPLMLDRPAAQPAPSPPVALRPREISVTDVDRLKADPFAFYAKTMLRLPVLDAIDADPGPAWKGSAVHDVLDAWTREDGLDPAKLRARIDALLSAPGVHPLMRALWQPRLTEAIEWIVARTIEQRHLRTIVASEVSGRVEVAGVRLRGRADRVDRTADGLAIVDYKTGKAPTAKAVAAGYAMQLGLLGLIAERGGFPDIEGQATLFEYWSLAKHDNVFGKVSSPVGARGTELTADNFVARAAEQFAAAAGRWLTGAEPFTAKIQPDYAPYEDYDHLMRFAEWYGRED